MHLRYSLFIFTLIVILASACSTKNESAPNPGDEALVSVNGKTLYRYELDHIIPNDLNATDSTLAAEAYIKLWIKEELMYKKALGNLNDEKRIDELVENYRQSLTIFTYQEQLLNERLTKTIGDNELEEYYNKNSDKFDLQTNIIKGLFLKVPRTSPQLEDLKKWYKTPTDKAVENIEKYTLQNAVIYDYFYNRWVDFDDVANNIPTPITDTKLFLQKNKYFETQDSAYVYMLNIKEYSLAGSTAPFEFVKGEILDILLNQKKEGFIKNFENELYENAIKKNEITFHKK